MRIEEITTESIRGVSDAELRNLRFRFIQLWAKMTDPEKRREYLERYKTLIDEFDRRELTRGRYPIDEALENYRRSKGLSAGFSDIVIVPEFVSIVGSFVETPAEAHDVDLLIRQPERDESLERKLMKVVESTGLAPHFIYEASGPHSSYIPLFDLVLRSRPFEVREVSGDQVAQAGAALDSNVSSYQTSDVNKAETLTFDKLGKYPLPKPAMAGITEARSVEALAGWCEGRTFVVEPKLNGYRVSVGKKGESVKIISDGLENRVEAFPTELVDYLRSIPHDFIIDSDVGIERDGKRLPRVQLARLNADKIELDEDERLVIVVFDLVWLDGADLHLEPFSERRRQLERFMSGLKDGETFRFELVPESAPMTSLGELKNVFDRFSKLPQSEGIVVKDVTGTYPLNGVWDSVAKLKNAAEFKVIVLAVEKTKDGNFVYEVGVLPGNTRFINTTEFNGRSYIYLGKTMASSIEAKPGDILTIQALEVAPITDDVSVDDVRLVFQNARVIDVDPSRRQPYYAEQVIDIAREFNVWQVEKVESNIDFEAGDQGRGCLQIHIMGLSEDEAKALKAAETGIMVARLDLKKLREKLLSVIGNHGCHLDLRLVRDGDDYFEGAEIFTGNIDGLSKFTGLDQGQKLRADFKVPQVDEPQAEVVRGPDDWLNVGARSIAIFEPGEVGAFSKTWSAMIRLDSFRWELYLAEPHAKKLHITDRVLSGNYLFAYVPVSPRERVWMISKLKDDDFEQETKSAEVEVEKVRQPFGSPGGKSRSAQLIIDYLPEHRVYVEPFAGGAAVFWNKRPSDLEVLNDKDSDIAFAYRFIKNVTDEQKKRLARKNWVVDEETYKRLLKLETADPVERFYKIVYLKRGGFSGDPMASAMPGHVGRHINIIADLDRYKARLKDVVIKNTDYSKVIDEFDSDDVVFYIDPPYLNQSQKGFAYEFKEDDWAELIERLKSVKGKFLLSSGSKIKEAPAAWDVKRYKVERQINQPGQREHNTAWEYLYANFKLTKRGLYHLTDVDKGVAQPFGSPGGGGKKFIAGMIVKNIPDHRTYVEAFAGGAAVFWRKDPSEVEVLNDKNPEVAFAYRFIKSLTTESIERLKKFDWISRRKKFNELIADKTKPASDEERFYRFYYTLKASYRNSQSTFSPGRAAGHSLEPDYNRLLKAKERLKNTKILNRDYKDVIREFDSKQTFFFLDPPYPDEWGDKDFGFDVSEFASAVKSIKGQFMITLNDTPDNRRLFKDYILKEIDVPRIWQPEIGVVKDSELLITNYPFRLKKEAELKSYEVKLLKGSAGDGDEHIVTGVVYEPEKVDAQGEYTDADEIRDACYHFMEAGAKFKLNHSGEPLDSVKLLENYIAPVTFELNGEVVKKGSWLMTLRVLDPELWQAIKEGRITGLSMAGYAYVEPTA